MTARFALVSDGTFIGRDGAGNPVTFPAGAVANIVLAPDSASVALASGLTIRLDDGTPIYSAPDAAPRSRLIAPLMFRERFTTAERGAITVAAAKSAAGGDPTLQVALDDQAAAQVVNLDDPAVAGFLQQLVTAGLLTADRPAVLLADPTPAELAPLA